MGPVTGLRQITGQRKRPGFDVWECPPVSAGSGPCAQSPLWMPPASLYAREQDDQRMMELGV